MKIMAQNNYLLLYSTVGFQLTMSFLYHSVFFLLCSVLCVHILCFIPILQSLFYIVLIIKEIIIAKCQNCLLTQTFQVYNPSSVRKNNRYFFTLKKGYTPETSVLIDNFDTL